MESNVSRACFFFNFNIGFSTIGKINVKTGKHISIQTNDFLFLLFYVGHPGPGHFGPSLEQLILVHDKFIISSQ